VFLALIFVTLSITVIFGLIDGYIFILLLLSITITDAAIGLGLLITLYKTNNVLWFQNLSTIS